MPEKEQRRQARPRVLSGPAGAVVMGSDLRVTGATGACHLCEREGGLLLSHVAPRWGFCYLKQEGGVIGSIRTKGIRFQSQDGPKHYLLCGSCEQYLGEAESYLALLSRGNPSELEQHRVCLRPGAVLQGVNARLVRRAVLGVLLKAHFATSSEFNSISLDPVFLPALRRRLLRDEYTSATHPVLATRWMSCEAPGANPRAMVVATLKSDNRYVLFDLMLGGWSWTVVLRGQNYVRRALPSFREQSFLNESAWVISLGELAISNAVVGGDQVLRRAGPAPKGWKTWPPASHCPCGTGLTFAECCAYTWCAV